MATPPKSSIYDSAIRKDVKKLVPNALKILKAVMGGEKVDIPLGMTAKQLLDSANNIIKLALTNSDEKTEKKEFEGVDDREIIQSVCRELLSVEKADKLRLESSEGKVTPATQTE